MSQWEMVKLGEVCRAESSNLAQKSLEDISGSYPVYGASGLVGYMDSFKQDKPYIAVIKDGAGVGRTYILPRESSVLGTMQYILPSDSTDIRFLYYGLTSLHLERYARGATIPHIYFKDYKESIFPLPPLETQQHMAKTLDLATEIIDGYRQKLTELEKLVQSVFYEMFGDSVENEKGWEKVSVSTLYTVTSSKRIYQENLVGYGIPFYKVSNLVDIIEGRKATPNTFLSIDLYNNLVNNNVVPKEGDILITARGTIGRCYIIDESDKFYFQDGMISWLKKTSTVIDNIYFIKVFESKRFLNRISNNTKGATVDFLTIAKLKEIQIPLPPLPLQEQFAQIVEKIEEEKALVQQSLQEAEQLFGGLLQGYFE